MKRNENRPKGRLDKEARVGQQESGSQYSGKGQSEMEQEGSLAGEKEDTRSGQNMDESQERDTRSGQKRREEMPM